MTEFNYVSCISFEDSFPVDSDKAVQVLLNIKPETIYEQIIQKGPREDLIEANNIPQFSSYDDIFSVLRIVDGTPEESLNWEKLGYYLCRRDAKSGAKIKYGENHYKLAVQLGLAKSEKNLSLTDLGNKVNKLERTEQERILSILILRLPIIQTALFYSRDKRFNIYEYMSRFLSDSTIRRRRSNIKTLLRKLDNFVTDEKMHNSIWNIVWEEQDYELP